MFSKILKKMGNKESRYTQEVENMKASNSQLREELRVYQTRLAGLEKDLSNFVIETRKVKTLAKENSNQLLSLSLLEEGRSTYVGKKRGKGMKTHTASSYA